MAQPPIRKKTYTFNFGNPETLIPSVKRQTSPGGGVAITDKVFKSSDDVLSMSFDNSKTNPKSDFRIVTGNASEGFVPYLTFERNATLSVSAQGANLIYVRIPAGEIIGGLTFGSTSPTNTGTFGPNSDYTYNMWENSDSKNLTVSSLVLNNESPIPPIIRTIEVCYELPRDILSPTSASIVDGAILNSFSSISLTFTNDMSVTEDAEITLTDGTNNYTLTANESGNVVTLTSATPITIDGTYTLTVAAGSFEDADYFRNEKLTYTFTILKNFEIQSVTPAEGVVTSIPNEIVLTFSAPVGTVDKEKVVKIVDANNTQIRIIDAANDGTYGVKLTFVTNTEPIVDNGVYRLIIPEKLVYDLGDNHYNAETTFIYNIGDLASDELKARAQDLLLKTGVGYPTAASAARVALAGLSTTASTSDYNTAIDNYLKTTDVELPVSGNYYYLKAVAKGGIEAYIKYANGDVQTTASSADATPFKVEGGAGAYAFVTPENKYLLQLGSTAKVSATATNLTIAKLVVTATGVTDEDVFGLFSLEGDLDGNDAFALVNMNGSFATNPGLGLVHFTASLTNGFALELVPDGKIPVADAVYTLNPVSGSSMSQLTAVTIAFPNITSVNLANQSLIKLIKSDNTQISPASVSQVTGKSNEYVMTFTDVKAGGYTLKIGKGVFTYNYTLPNSNVISADVQAILATYTVTTGDDFVYDFTQKNTIYPIGPMNQAAPKDVDLNNLIFYSDDVKIGVSNEIVKILNFNTSEVVAQGKFKVVDYNNKLPVEAKNAKGIVKLVLDSKIVEGSLPAAQYAYRIEAGTFGDENFGAYHADPSAFLATGKTKADCHANPYIYYIIEVNNAAPEHSGGGDNPDNPSTPSAEMLAKVKKYLDMKGVGYPASDAPERIALLNKYTTKSASDDVFGAMLNSYLSSSNIERPATGKYYTIAAQSSNGKKVYLTYADGDVTVTADAAKASVFKATTTSAGKTSFATADGLYLTALTASGNLLVAHNVTVNDLTLNILPVGNDQLEKSFGLVSLKGIKNDVELMSKVNVKTVSIVTTDNTFAFSADLTTGFKLTETDPSVVPAPTPAWTLSPVSGNTVTSLKTIDLTITGVNDVKLADKSKITIFDGQQTFTALTVNTVSDGKFSLVFPELDGGDYTLTIGEGAFTFTFLERTVNVETITANYSVLQYPSETVLNYATLLLSHTGVGYPVSGSASRVALQELVNSRVGSDKIYQAAINAYKAETNIEKPVNDKFYRIAAHTNVNTLSYLRYHEGNISMTGNASNAAIFKTIANSDGTLSLATLDGKYLNIQTKDGANVSESAVKLIVARLLVDGIADDNSYGLVCLNYNGKYATVNVPSAFVMDAQSATSLSGDVTSGFVFTEVDKSEVQMPDASFTLTPVASSSVEALTKVALTFDAKAIISLKDQSLIGLKNLSSSQVYAPKSIDKGQDNTFVMNFLNLPMGVYKLTIGKGAFVIDFLGSETPVQEITAVYTVSKNPEPITDFDQIVDVEWVESVGSDEYISDIELNTFTLSANAPITLNSDANAVTICKLWNQFAPVATGHLEYAVNEARSVNRAANDSYTLKLVLDDEIKAGDLSDDTYVIIIPEGTFGDANYAKYLENPESIALSDCHVNAELKYTVRVENPKATFALTPAVGSTMETLTKVTLTFDSKADVSLKDKSLISLRNLINSRVYTPKGIDRVKDKTYEISFLNLPAAVYRLTFGEGAFVMEFHGYETPIQEISVVYSVSKDPAPATDFVEIAEVEWVEAVGSGEYICDKDLNTFTLSAKTPMTLNPDAKSVTICESDNLFSPVATGHLEYASDEASDSYTLKLVLDQEIKAGDLGDGIYVIIIPAYSFGDDNYAEYLDDPESIALSDCHVNTELKYTVKVQNPTGIHGIRVSAADGEIYDMSGCRVQILVPGKVYIKDGKKYVIKK